jgi:hypothetical protein
MRALLNIFIWSESLFSESLVEWPKDMVVKRGCRVLIWLTLAYRTLRSHARIRMRASTWRNSNRFWIRDASLRLTNWGVWRSGSVDPRLLDADTSWRWVVNFTHLPLYRREKSPQYSLYMRFREPQSRSGRFREEKILYPSGNQTLTPRSSFP